MFTFSSLVVFVSASLLLALAPGPDIIFVLTQSAIKGRRIGFVVTLGLCTGLMVHTTAVALGVAAIFQASATAFNCLKYAGAAYLLYLAWGAFRAGAMSLDGPEDQERNLFRYYLRGIIMNVTNPKVSIFFLAFLPQFTHPEQGHLPLQMIILGALFILSTLVVFGATSLLASYVGKWLRRSTWVQRWLNKIAGTIFAGLALKLATVTR